MNTMNDAEREKKINVMKVMILKAEQENLRTREKTATQMSEHIVTIIKNIHNRKDI